MLTSSCTTFTFEVSTLFWLIRPAPFNPGCDTMGAPDAVVSDNRLLPNACRPGGLIKFASWMVQICALLTEPGCVTETVPSWPTVSDVALAGIVIAGITGKPDCVTN